MLSEMCEMTSHSIILVSLPAYCLSVGGIFVTLNTWSYMIPMGLGSAVNTCVGNALGAGDGKTARRRVRDERRISGEWSIGFPAFLIHTIASPLIHRSAIVGLALAVAVEAMLVTGVAAFGENMVGSVSPNGQLSPRSHSMRHY